MIAAEGRRKRGRFFRRGKFRHGSRSKGDLICDFSFPGFPPPCGIVARIDLRKYRQLTVGKRFVSSNRNRFHLSGSRSTVINSETRIYFLNFLTNNEALKIIERTEREK